MFACVRAKVVDLDQKPLTKRSNFISFYYHNNWYTNPIVEIDLTINSVNFQLFWVGHLCLVDQVRNEKNSIISSFNYLNQNDIIIWFKLTRSYNWHTMNLIWTAMEKKDNWMSPLLNYCVYEKKKEISSLIQSLRIIE